MTDYDNKLGEWFRQVEQQEQELKAKKSGETLQNAEEPRAVTEDVPAPAPPAIQTMEIEGPAREAPASVVATVEAVGVVADTTLAGETPVADTPQAARLFPEEEAPQVEDFFSFLSRSSEQPAVEQVEEDLFELPKGQGVLHVSEGTGEPRPLNPPPAAPPVEASQAQPALEMSLPPKPVAPPTPQVVEQPEPAEDDQAQANWDRVPRHLQTLFGSTGNEVAQHSYKAFKETREELIQRLLDPTVSLEEAARILNVCPTTVRRYTNRGVLKHFRTAGNQRRFRLSDVLVFMEGGQARADAED